MSRKWCETVSPSTTPFLDRLMCTEGQANSPASYVYCGIVFLATIVALCLKQWAVGHGLEDCPVIDKCECNSCVEDNVVMRISCGFFIWFTALALACAILPAHVAAEIYFSWWIAKISFCVVLCVGFFFIPNGFFEGYAYFASCCSGLFMLLQVMVLLDWAYAWNETWRGIDAADRLTCWRLGLLVFSAAMLLAALGIGGTMFYWFDCPRAIVANCCNMVVWIACTVLSITQWCHCCCSGTPN